MAGKKKPLLIGPASFQFDGHVPIKTHSFPLMGRREFNRLYRGKWKYVKQIPDLTKDE